MEKLELYSFKINGVFQGSLNDVKKIGMGDSTVKGGMLSKQNSFLMEPALTTANPEMNLNASTAQDPYSGIYEQAKEFMEDIPAPNQEIAPAVPTDPFASNMVTAPEVPAMPAMEEVAAVPVEPVAPVAPEPVAAMPEEPIAVPVEDMSKNEIINKFISDKFENLKEEICKFVTETMEKEDTTTLNVASETPAAAVPVEPVAPVVETPAVEMPEVPAMPFMEEVAAVPVEPVAPVAPEPVAAMPTETVVPAAPVTEEPVSMVPEDPVAPVVPKFEDFAPAEPTTPTMPSIDDLDITPAAPAAEQPAAPAVDDGPKATYVPGVGYDYSALFRK